MTTVTDNLSDQLAEFGATQLASMNPGDIARSSIHLILATAFFTGATIQLSKSLKLSKKVYLETLTQFLATKFGLSINNARGSVETNARLYKRYVLVEKCFNHGWKAAQAWNKNVTSPEDSLRSLLKRHQDLSMSNLSIEGVKEEKVIEPLPTKVEVVAQVETPPVMKEVSKPENKRHPVFWSVFTLSAIFVGYVGLHPELIPQEIHTVLQDILLRIEKTELPFLN